MDSSCRLASQACPKRASHAHPFPLQTQTMLQVHVILNRYLYRGSLAVAPIVHLVVKAVRMGSMDKMASMGSAVILRLVSLHLANIAACSPVEGVGRHRGQITAWASTVSARPGGLSGHSGPER